MKFDRLHLSRGALYCVLLLVVGTIRWWADWFTDRELTIRSVGFTLQVLGFGWVLLDVTSAARKHRIPSLLSVVKSKFGRKNVLVSVGTAIGSVNVVGHGASITVTPAKPTLKERLLKIEQEQIAIKGDIDHLRKESREATSELSSRIEQRASALSLKVQEIKADIKDAAAGLIHIEVIGIWLFGLGSALSTFSKEIAECAVIFG